MQAMVVAFLGGSDLFGQGEHYCSYLNLVLIRAQLFTTNITDGISPAVLNRCYVF